MSGLLALAVLSSGLGVTVEGESVFYRCKSQQEVEFFLKYVRNGDRVSNVRFSVPYTPVWVAGESVNWTGKADGAIVTLRAQTANNQITITLVPRSAVLADMKWSVEARAAPGASAFWPPSEQSASCQLSY